MGRREKKFNKWLIGAIIGGTIVGLGGLSMTPKGKSFLRRMYDKIIKILDFFKLGVDEMMKKRK